MGVSETYSYLVENRYLGNFVFCRYFSKFGPVFIILGIFFAIIFYVHSYMDGSALDLSNGILYTMVNDPKTIFICVTLISSFSIELILTWTILCGALKFDYKNKSDTNGKLNLVDEIVSVFKRYLFIFLFYAFIFYSLSYMLHTYFSNFRIFLALLSIIIQALLAHVIHIEVERGDMVNNIKDKKAYEFVPYIATVLMLACLVIFWFYGKNNAFLDFVFLFPVILFLMVFVIGVSEMYLVLKQSYHKYLGHPDMEVNRDRANIMAVWITAIGIGFIVVALGSQGLLPYNNNIAPTRPVDQIVGNWSCVNGECSYYFYNNYTFIANYNSTIYTGGWRKYNDTCFKLSMDRNDYPDFLNERNILIFEADRGILYAINDSRFWLQKIIEK